MGTTEAEAKRQKVVDTSKVDPVDNPFDIFNGFGKEPRKMKVICIGAGMVGLHMAGRIREFTTNIDFKIFEMNPEVGGVWYLNRYPNVACDVPSHAYVFTHSPYPFWQRFQAPGSDCHNYTMFLADKTHARDYIVFEQRVNSCTWDAYEGLWTVRLTDLKTGKEYEERANVVVNGGGILSQPKYPEIPGLDDFNGPMMHTARWKEYVDIKGKRIALVGAGSSAIQTLPALQKIAGKVDMYIKSKTWITSLVAAKERDRFFGFTDAWEGQTSDDLDRINPKYSPETIERFKSDPQYFHEHRKNIVQEINRAFYNRYLWRGSKLNNQATSAVEKLTLAKLENSPELLNMFLRAYFKPDFSVGCRRPTPGLAFLTSIQKSNVEVVHAGAAKVTKTGIVDTNDEERQYDIIIFATGFHTDLRPPFQVTGRDGYSLNTGDFQQNPRSYMISCLPNTPNYFTPAGPFLTSINGELLGAFEKIVDYIMKCILKLQKERYKSLCAKNEAIYNFTAYADTYMDKTVHMEECNSWYKKNPSGHIRTNWCGTTSHAIEMLEDPRWEDFDYQRMNGEENGPSQFNYVGDGRGWTEHETGDSAFYVPLVEDPFKEFPKYGEKGARKRLPSMWEA